MSDRRNGGGGMGGKKKAAAGLGAAAVVILAIVQLLGGGDVEDVLSTLTGGNSGETASAPAPAGRVAAQAQAPADLPFDYYVLALSWSPSFCEDRPDADQCGNGHRFIVHGLWPQYERGFPSDCETTYRRPDSTTLRRYAFETTKSTGLLAHQWRKHGTCTGMRPADYFDATLRASRVVTTPPSLVDLSKDLDVDPRVVEKAFIDANPGFTRDMVTIKCRDNKLTEVRVCLTTDLKPRACGKDVIRDCRARVLDVPAPR